MALFYKYLHCPASSTIDTLEIGNAIFDEVIVNNNVHFDDMLQTFQLEKPDPVIIFYPSTPYVPYSQMIGNTNLIKKLGIPSSNSFASSTLLPGGYLPNEAFDLSASSQWACKAPPASSGEYIGINLGSIQNVSEFAIAWDGDFFAKTVTLQSSNDGNTWHNIQTFNKDSYGSTEGTRYVLTNGVSAKYFRFYFTNANVSEVGYRIKEISLFDNSAFFAMKKYECGDYVNILSFPVAYASTYGLKYILFDELSNIIKVDNLTLGTIDTSNAKYIGFIVSPNYASRKIPISFETTAVDTSYFPDDWSDEINLHAKFENSIVAGGLEYDSKNINNDCGFLIKRRSSSELIWSTVGFINGSKLTIENFLLTGQFTDRTAVPNIDYLYMVVPVLYGSELSGASTKTFTRCYTDGISLSDNETTYYTDLEAKLNSITQNKGTTIVDTLNGEYPFSFKTGSLNYITGTGTGLFAPINNDNEYIFGNNSTWQYQKDLRRWLCNGKPKYLKFYDGRTFLINITDSVTDDNSEHNGKNITTFNFAEIGDSISIKDLIDFGIIEIY